MNNYKLNTPIVFIIFNRPHITQKVFEAIQKAQPPVLFIIADGPRSNRPDDVGKCQKTREIVKNIDWDCQVKTQYSDTNLGGARRVSSGLDWVFNTVEEAIILEDDCLPDPSFFPFCENLLNYYRYDERIMQISGTNFQFEQNKSDYSYYFSYFNHVWGWATWKRAWKYFDFDMSLWPILHDKNWLNAIFNGPRDRKYWTKFFKDNYDNRVQNWDYRWTFACWAQNGLTIVPKHNLVSNIGFGKDATHTIDELNPLANLPTQKLYFPLVHPPFIMRNFSADIFTQNRFYHQSAWLRLVQKSRKILQRLKTG